MNKALRKTHAERSEETRQKIIDAVVYCIAEKGFKKTTTSAIAKQAGVTWGAIQHHFGGLNGCLVAAFDDSFHRFTQTLGEPPSQTTSLHERTVQFIQAAWQHYSSPHYLSMFQLLLHDMNAMKDSQWQNASKQIVIEMDEIWKRFFADAVPDQQQRHMLARYTHSVLTGLAVSYSHHWQENEMQAELLLLQQSLLNFMQQTQNN